MEVMFYNATSFNHDIGAWDISKVTNMSGMFQNATAFNGDIGSWNTAAVSKMYAMFNLAIAFNQDIGSWNTAAVTTMSNQATFFNQNLSRWCFQNNFDFEPLNFKLNANSAWATDGSKQPDWDGAAYP